MVIISKLKHFAGICANSILLRGMSILLLTVVIIFAIQAVVLVTAARNRVFTNKKTMLLNEAETIASSMNSNSVLTSAMAEEVMNVLGVNSAERVVITNGDAIVLYSSDTSSTAVGVCALYPELVSALRGNDTFRCVFEDGVFLSHGAIPIMSSGNIIGAVLLTEYDAEQATLLSLIRSTATNFALLFLLIGFLVYLVFAVIIIKKNSRILVSIGKVYEGDYSQRIDEKGRDEFAVVAAAFNRMTTQLEETEQSRRQFVSDASHELRTPLAAIRLLSDSIIQNDMDLATVREFVQDISGEADRLTRMTTKLLSLSALDSRQNAKQELVPVNLSQCCKKAVRMLSPLAQEHHGMIEESSEEDCYVLATEDDIFQLVMNLSENGIKYSGENGKVRLIAYTQSETAYLIVEDNGIGIPEDELGKIFERFYRVDKARSRAQGGTGLGLSIVSDTVEKYGGSVSASNRQQGGARFTVCFPALTWEGEL